MAIRLIDTKATRPVTIEGTTFNLRTLTNGEKATIANRMQKLQENEEGYDELLRLIAPAIASIEGMATGDIVDFLIRIESVESQMELIMAVIDSASLTEDESKNSDSSSGISISPTGDATVTNVTTPSVFVGPGH